MSDCGYAKDPHHLLGPDDADYEAWHARMEKDRVRLRCPECRRWVWWQAREDGRLVSRSRLTFLRQAYQRQVQQHLGPTANDLAISVPGGGFIIDEILRRATKIAEERQRRGVGTDQVRVLDMGLGFLTFALADAAAMWDVEEHIAYQGRDHDAEWISWVQRLLGEHRYGPMWRLAVIDREHVGTYDVIIVDHGHPVPAEHLPQRARDTPWLASQLAPGGVIFFDDWRPKHEGRIRRAMATVAGDWQIEEAPGTKRYERDKAIGVVRLRTEQTRSST